MSHFLNWVDFLLDGYSIRQNEKPEIFCNKCIGSIYNIYQGSSCWAYLEAAEHCGEGTISFGSSQLYLELPPSLSLLLVTQLQVPGPSGVGTHMQCCIPTGYLSCNPP